MVTPRYLTEPAELMFVPLNEILRLVFDQRFCLEPNSIVSVLPI